MNQGIAPALPLAALADLLFPLFAFVCIVILPSLAAVWVIVKTVTEQSPSDQRI